MNRSEADAIYRDKSQIIISGHRGVRAIAPENTLPSFELAFGLGLNSIEYDINLTADNIPVVIHDTTVDRTTDGVGAVRSYTLAELKKLDASAKFTGHWNGDTPRIPTLDELCDLLDAGQHNNLLMNVEIKDFTTEAVNKTVKLLDKRGYLGNCVFTCFDATIIAYIKDEYDLPTQGFHESQLKNFVPGKGGTYSKMYAVGIPMNLLSAEKCKFFEEMGILAWSYCPDNDDDVQKSLDSGARLMTCNDPRPALRRLYGSNI